MNVEILKETSDLPGAIAKITINKGDYKSEYNKTITSYIKNMKLPGFRPGNIPRSVIEKRFGNEIKAELINKTASQALNDYFKNEKIHLAFSPVEVENQEINLADEEHCFEFKISIVPELNFNLSDFSSIKQHDIEIDDESLEEHIDVLRKQHAEYIKLEALPESIEKAEHKILIQFKEIMTHDHSEEHHNHEHSFVLKGEELSERFFSTIANQAEGFEFESSINDISDLEEVRTHIASKLHLSSNEDDLNKVNKLKIQYITYYKDAELNQEFFAKIYGEEVVDLESFKTKLKDALKWNYTAEDTQKIKSDIIEIIKQKYLPLVDEELARIHYDGYLSRQQPNDNNANQQLSQQEFINQILYYRVIDQIQEVFEINPEREEIIEYTRGFQYTRYKEYGYPIEGEILEKVVEDYLKKEENFNYMYQLLVEDSVYNKIIEESEFERVTTTLKEFRNPKN